MNRRRFRFFLWPSPWPRRVARAAQANVFSMPTGQTRARK